MKILVTYAVQGEFTELKFPGLIGEEEVQVGYLRTGIGKVKSAFYLTDVYKRQVRILYLWRNLFRRKAGWLLNIRLSSLWTILNITLISPFRK